MISDDPVREASASGPPEDQTLDATIRVSVPRGENAAAVAEVAAFVDRTYRQAAWIAERYEPRSVGELAHLLSELRAVLGRIPAVRKADGPSLTVERGVICFRIPETPSRKALSVLAILLVLWGTHREISDAASASELMRPVEVHLPEREEPRRAKSGRSTIVARLMTVQPWTVRIEIRVNESRGD